MKVHLLIKFEVPPGPTESIDIARASLGALRALRRFGVSSARIIRSEKVDIPNLAEAERALEEIEMEKNKGGSDA